MTKDEAASAVDWLFTRFLHRWPRLFLSEYEGLDMEQIREEWIADLARFSKREVMQAFEALRNREFPPTLPTFCTFCKAHPQPAPAKALPRNFTDEELAYNRRKVQEMRDMLASAKRMPQP